MCKKNVELTKSEIEFLHRLVLEHGVEHHGVIKEWDAAYASLRKKLRLWEAQFIADNQTHQDDLTANSTK